jgi:hypothetical protein
MARGAVSEGAAVGLVGAASVVVVEMLVARLGIASAVGRGAVRLGLAAGAGLAVERLGAPDAVARGVVAGPVLVTALDVGVAMIPRRPRIDPPPVSDPARAGDPWPPRAVV